MTFTNTIEIVSHCWNGHLPIYAPMLRAQGLSLINYSRHKCQVSWSVFFEHSDTEVWNVLTELEPSLLRCGVVVFRFPVCLEELFQRSIGRNTVALSTGADCVWFCDCDYMFVDGCLDSAIEAAALSPNEIVYPIQVAVTSHEDGDAIIQRMQDKKSLDPAQLAQFYNRDETKAIGGIQIVHGDLARSRGYLNNTKWQQPQTKVDVGFFQTGSDVRYRKSIGKQCQRPITGVHRIRHSRRAYNGTVVDPK